MFEPATSHTSFFSCIIFIFHVLLPFFEQNETFFILIYFETMKLLTIQHKYKISNRVNQLDQPIQKFAMLLPAPLHFGSSLQLCDDLTIAQLHPHREVIQFTCTTPYSMVCVWGNYNHRNFQPGYFYLHLLLKMEHVFFLIGIEWVSGNAIFFWAFLTWGPL